MSDSEKQEYRDSRSLQEQVDELHSRVVSLEKKMSAMTAHEAF